MDRVLLVVLEIKVRLVREGLLVMLVILVLKVILVQLVLKV